MNMSKAVSTPSSSAVFTTLVISLFYFYPLDQPAMSAARSGSASISTYLVQGMSAVADCAKSIQCWDADRGGEVAV